MLKHAHMLSQLECLNKFVESFARFKKSQWVHNDTSFEKNSFRVSCISFITDNLNFAKTTNKYNEPEQNRTIFHIFLTYVLNRQQTNREEEARKKNLLIFNINFAHLHSYRVNLPSAWRIIFNNCNVRNFLFVRQQTSR